MCSECIKCGNTSSHSICSSCADGLLDAMSPHDRMAHSLVGLDVLSGEKNLKAKITEYKKLPIEELTGIFWKRSGRFSK